MEKGLSKISYQNRVAVNKTISDCFFLDKENELFVKRLISLNNITKQIHVTHDFSSLLAISLDLLMDFFLAEKAMFIMKNEDTQEIKVKLAVNLFNEHEKTEKFINGFVKNLLEDESKSFFINQINNKDFKTIKSCLVGFLEVSESFSGYIILFNSKNNLFDEKDIFSIEELSNQIAISINNALSYENLKKENEHRTYLQRYFPANMASKIVQKKVNLNLSGTYQESSVLFCKLNIDNCENINPTDFFKLINTVTTLITQIVFSYNGLIEKISSESIIASFGIPTKTENHSELAVVSALEIITKLNEIKNDKYNVKLTIGVNTGEILYGNIGFFQRHDFSICGAPLKIAEKIANLDNENTVFITSNTYELVENKFRFNEKPHNIDDIQIFEVLEKLSNEEIEKNLNTLRIHSRISLKTIAYLVKSNLRSTGVVRDISIGGVSIGTVGNYKLNDNIIMTFKLSDSLTLRNIKGIVKRIDKSKFDSVTNKINTIMGIEFVNLSLKDHEDILNFISESEKIKLVQNH